MQQYAGRRYAAIFRQEICCNIGDTAICREEICNNVQGRDMQVGDMKNCAGRRYAAICKEKVKTIM